MTPEQAVIEAAERLVTSLFTEEQRSLSSEFWELVEALKQLRYSSVTEFFDDAA